MRTLIVLFCCLFVLSCKSTKDLNASADQKNALEQIAKEKSFEITSKWAFPTNGSMILANSNLLPDMNNGSSINLISITNFIKKKGDSIFVDLPFFGVRQMAGSYDSDTNISFNGEPSTFKMTYNEKKDRYRIYFRMRKNQETFGVTIYLFPNLTAEVNVNSSHRSQMNYRGKVKEI